MKSKTSFFNTALMRKNTLRFSPIWITYLAVWFVAIPLMMGVQLSNPVVDVRPDAMDVAGYIGGALRVLGPAVACVYGVILAMALLSYLYSARSVSMYHSLPIRRSGLYLTNYCSGLLFIAVPNAVVAVITAVVILYFLFICLTAPFALIIFLPLGGAVVYIAVSRIREIKKEDSDDYRKY